MSFYNVAKNIVKVVLMPFNKVIVTYDENIYTDKGFILVCNHISDLDPPMLGITCKRMIRFMAKEELFKIPVLGFILKRLHTFPVARGKGDHKAIDNAIEIVNEGGILGIFPEGGRSKDGKLQKAKSGASIVAGQTMADIVPAGIKYGKRHFLRKEVFVHYGKRITVEELGVDGMDRQKLRAANKLIMEKIAGLIGVEAP